MRSNIPNFSESRKRCAAFRKRILDISQQVSALHIAPAFSCLEIVDVIYFASMRRNAEGLPIDIFLMSKGHGCVAQYVVLEQLGILSPKDLELYCRPEGQLGAHPDYGVPGIAASTGSLGHGLGIACGMAYANSLTNSDAVTYVLLSDGELQEGSTWEALMMAANLKLTSLVAVVDNNDFSGLERMSIGHPAFYPLEDKIQAFGWEVRRVKDGHDPVALYHAMLDRPGERPLMVVAQTVKGKGVSYMENVPIWHYRSPSPAEYVLAVAELENQQE